MTRCIAAYNSLCINHDGTLDPCCQYTRSTDLTPLRFTEFPQYQQIVQQTMHDDFINSREHPGCQKCIYEEGLNWTSLRQNYDSWYGNQSNDSVSADNPILHLEVRLGNFCNLNCFMCHPGNSSSIAQERQKHRKEFENINVYVGNGALEHYWETNEFNEFSADILKNVQRVSITGGEPFIIPEVLKLLDHLMDRKDTVHILFNTNLTKLPVKLLDRLEKFLNLNIAISLEGVGAHNDYIRWPSQWEIIDQNIQTLKSRIPTALLMVNHTVQHTSIYSLPLLSEYCNQNMLPMQFTMVQGDPMWTLNTVPPEELAQFAKWAKKSGLRRHHKNFIVNGCAKSVYDPEQHNRFQQYHTLLDSIRGTDFNKTFL